MCSERSNTSVNTSGMGGSNAVCLAVLLIVRAWSWGVGAGGTAPGAVTDGEMALLVPEPVSVQVSSQEQGWEAGSRRTPR